MPVSDFSSPYVTDLPATGQYLLNGQPGMDTAHQLAVQHLRAVRGFIAEVALARTSHAAGGPGVGGTGAGVSRYAGRARFT
jgi:hypothetical protein